MIRIGIICPSEIAFRRFLPSLRNVKEFTFAGVAIASPAEWAGAENVTDKTCASIENERIKACMLLGYPNMTYARTVKSSKVTKR